MPVPHILVSVSFVSVNRAVSILQLACFSSSFPIIQVFLAATSSVTLTHCSDEESKLVEEKECSRSLLLKQYEGKVFMCVFACIYVCMYVFRCMHEWVLCFLKLYCSSK